MSEQVLKPPPKKSIKSSTLSLQTPWTGFEVHVYRMNAFH